MCKNVIGSATKYYLERGKVRIESMKIPCGSWECPDCGKKRAIMLGNRVKGGFENERARLLTLTYEGRKTLCDGIRCLKYSWNRLRGELVRKYGLSKFFWALEGGSEHGRPHLHVLINCYVPQKRLVGLARRCGFGRIVDIRSVKDGGGFGYVFKYLSKGLGSYAVLRALKDTHGRRYGVSRNIKPVASKNGNGVCLEFIKDEFSEEYRIANCNNIIGAFCKKNFTWQKFPSVYRAEAELDCPEEVFREAMEMFKLNQLSKLDILEIGGWQTVKNGENFVAANKSRTNDPDLDSLPF